MTESNPAAVEFSANIDTVLALFKGYYPDQYARCLAEAALQQQLNENAELRAQLEDGRKINGTETAPSGIVSAS